MFDAALKLTDTTLRHSSCVLASFMGDFTGRHNGRIGHELILLKTSGLIELYCLSVKGSGDSENEEEETSNNSKEVSLVLACRLETRSILRSGEVIRLTGSKRDVLAVTSDSGALSILQFEPKEDATSTTTASLQPSSNPSTSNVRIDVKQLHCPVYGNTGCRRSIPGQHIGVDPKGRAIMIGAIEKRKLVYVMNRDSSNRSILASPLEVHRPNTITLDLVGLDTGFDNPMFASLEIHHLRPDGSLSSDGDYSQTHENGYEDNDENKSKKKPLVKKYLVYYELDLGLNSVSLKWLKEVHPRASCIAPIPGGGDGPGGVLVGSEDYVEYCHHDTEDHKSTPARRLICPIPRRTNHPSSKGILVQKIVVQRQKRQRFFALCQTELGDVFKITLQFSEADGGGVTNMTIALLDTLPVASCLNISKLGMLFVSSEIGYSNKLYHFERIDVEEDDAAVVVSCEKFWNSNAYQSKLRPSSSNDDGEEQPSNNDIPIIQYDTALAETCDVVPTFGPTYLKNLLPLTEIETLSPALGLLVGELVGNEVSPQFYIPCGRGNTSQLTILRHGVAVHELAISELPGTPGNIFAVRDPVLGKDDKYIVISFADATLFLEISPQGIEEVVDAESQGFITNAPTLAVGALGNPVGSDGMGGAGIVQVHPEGVRHIFQNQANEWRCAGLKKFEHSSCNEYQILATYKFSGEIIYFELDAQGSGSLVEVATSDVGNGSEILCVDVGPVPKGRARASFAAVGCRDGSVRIVTLSPNPTGHHRSSNVVLSQKSMTSCPHPSRPYSVCLTFKGFGDSELELIVGLDDGSTIRYDVDSITGSILSASSSASSASASASLGTSGSKRILGTRPVKVIRSNASGSGTSSNASLLLSSRPWISTFLGGGGSSGGRTMTSPISYAPLDHAHSLKSHILGGGTDASGSGQGIVATVGNTLRILSIDTKSINDAITGSYISNNYEPVFHTNQIALRYTPRQLCLLGGSTTSSTPTFLALVEADVLEYSRQENLSLFGFDPQKAGKKIKASKTSSKKIVDKEDDDAMDMDMDMDMDEGDDDLKKKKEAASKKEGDDDNEDEDDEEDESTMLLTSTPVRSPVPSSSSSWASCIRLIDPRTSQTVLGGGEPLELDKNEAALCCCDVQFASRSHESLLAVGTATSYNLQTQSCVAAHIYLFRVVDGGQRLQLLHKTKVERPVLAMTSFQGRLLVGVGRTLRLYEMGKRQLLRKCEVTSMFPTLIKLLKCTSDRVVGGDLLHGVYVFQYIVQLNKFELLARDMLSARCVTALELLDFHTFAVADKFGSISVLRLPKEAAASASAASSSHAGAGGDASAARALLWDTSFETRTPRLELLCQYFVGDIVTSMTRANVMGGGGTSGESLLYVTITGRMGALNPSLTKTDMEFLELLERQMFSNTPDEDNGGVPRYTGRDPRSYRSYYVPVKNVVDGDLCDYYIKLSIETQKLIAERMDMTVHEIKKKLNDLRSALL